MGIAPGTTPDNFMNQIYTDFSAIDNSLFSIFIKNSKKDDESLNSTLTIGSYNPGKFGAENLNNQGIQWVANTVLSGSGQMWSAKLINAKFGSVQVASESRDFIFNTNQNDIYVPSNDFDRIKSTL